MTHDVLLEEDDAVALNANVVSDQGSLMAPGRRAVSPTLRTSGIDDECRGSGCLTNPTGPELDEPPGSPRPKQ